MMSQSPWSDVPGFDTISIPLYATFASGCVGVLQVVAGALLPGKRASSEAAGAVSSSTPQDSSRDGTLYPSLEGDASIFRFEVARLVSCVALLALSLPELLFPARRGSGLVSSTLLGMVAVYGYSSGIALASITIKPSQARGYLTAHLAWVLIATWATYMYRDVWPLATYYLEPLDREEGGLLWARIAILTIAAVVIPLVTPRRFHPAHPEDTSSKPIPEQTAPILSLITVSFLDDLVWKGSGTLDRLPPLSDVDHSAYLVEKSFPHLDPFQVKKKRNIFFGLMAVYLNEYIMLCVVLAIRTVTRLGAPIGIYKLLEYLETGGQAATIRPWFWIVWLFVGPVLSLLAMQFYMFRLTRVMVQMQAIFTQLIFNHSLRLRTMADASHTGSSGSASSNDQGSNTLGKLYNLATSDITYIIEGREFLQVVLYTPLQVTLSMVFLYSILGWSAFVGLATMLLAFPMSGYFSTRLRKAQGDKMRRTDVRVQAVSETINVIRMIKMFAWERRALEDLDEKREEELKHLLRFKILGMVSGNFNYLIPLLSMISTFFAYTALMGEDLTASRVFSSMAIFDVVRNQLSGVFRFLPEMMRAKVSLDRMTDFLYDAELLDVFSGDKSPALHSPALHGLPEEGSIGIKNATFAWTDYNETSTDQRFLLRVDEEIVFQRGKVNLIVGPTGSGKTAMLLALLGEMHCIPGDPDSYVSLPRSGGIAYVPQEPWIQSDSIRGNIVFGSSINEERYRKVIHQCCLEEDLGLFEDGDMTQVGERGLTLSGGQKARVSLARAVYSSAEVVLIDDVFAALDVHTARFIIERCFKGDLMRGRTVLLVTHHIALVHTLASWAVILAQDATISRRGEWSKVIAQDTFLSNEIRTEEEAIQARQVEAIKAPESLFPQKKTSVTAEEVLQGRAAWPAIKLYLASMGGGYTFIFWFSVVAFILVSQAFAVLQTYWLGYWAQQSEHHDHSESLIAYYLGVYACLLMADYASLWVSYLVYTFGTIRASRNIHKSLIESILSATLRWINGTPSSRIITRCTQDIQSIDGPLAGGLRALLDKTASMGTSFFAIILVSPVFTIPGAMFTVLGGWCGQMYMRAQLPVKREQSVARAPILGHLAATVSGIVSVRAYGAQEQFVLESFQRIDRYSRATCTFFNLNRWVSLRLEALSWLITACLATILVYGGHGKASTTGFALNMAVGFSGMILWWVRVLNDFEVDGNSLERVEQYRNIEHESPPLPSGIPPAFWPVSGHLRAENLSARYSESGPRVLHDVSFEIKSGERVGIVGRTGSGKSSLVLALLRLIPTEGQVFYDGLRTDEVNLDALRSHITIIPQIPELLSCSLRQNLDPRGEFDDAALNDALRAAGLFSLGRNESGGLAITLDTLISSGGANVSVGQRQIIALARAMLRQSKLLVLDEATSAIDYETDAIIQKSLREAVAKDVTVLTIAHRLQTVMDADKILVLDSGRVSEFGVPVELLRDKNGMLSVMVNGSNDREALLRAAAME